VVPLDAASGGTCPACGRKYAATVLGDAATQIVSPGALCGEGSPAPELAAQAPPDPHRGEVLGHFRILAEIGHGGMGTVYRALDESLQRYVALKVVRAVDATAADSRHIQRLLQEAIAQARVNHPNIVHIYYVGRDGNTPFFAMELVNGPTLARRLADAPLPFAEVVDMAGQLAEALRHAADYDVVHGDIKPGNVLLAGPHTVKLSDFGLARRLSEMTDPAAGIVGTPNYLAPEAVQGAPPDVRSDLYSLGVTLFEMTFGRLPYSFTGSGLRERFRAHQEAAIEFPDPWPKTLPEGWRAVLARLLAKDPEARYQDYAELLEDLRRLRPVVRPAAGRVPRGLAWLVDLALANTAQQVFRGSLTLAALSFPGTRPGLQLFVALLSGLVPLFCCYLQARWKTTPGKTQ
jgi:serine/threonine protein kinase